MMRWLPLLLLSTLCLAATYTSNETGLIVFDPTVTETGDNGYVQYRPAVGAIAGEVVDMRTASWIVQNSYNDNPTELNDCNNGANTIQEYPVNIDGQDNVWLVGGLIYSEVPQVGEWKAVYGANNECNSTALLIRASDNAQAIGWRIMGAWDAFGVGFNPDITGDDATDFSLRRSWISNVRDDCVENDQLRSGTISDVLFDGCFVGFSLRPVDADPQGSQQFNHKVVIDSVYLRLKLYDYRTRYTDPLQTNISGHVFKSSGKAPSVEIHNSVFAYSSDTVIHSDSDITYMTERMVACTNNKLLLLTNDAFPAFFDLYPDSCFTKFRGQEAIDLWDSLKQNWINCHPDVRRDVTDPTSTAANCVDPDTL